MDKSELSLPQASKWKEDSVILRTRSTFNKAESKEFNSLPKIRRWKDSSILEKYRNEMGNIQRKKLTCNEESYVKHQKVCALKRTPEKLLFISKENLQSYKIRRSPARFCAVQRESSEIKRKTPERTLDLLLLKEINLENSNKKLELEKFYFEKYISTHNPTTFDDHFDSFLKSPKKKRVTFCL